MPGITGVISKAPVEESHIDQMIECMVHESFYTSGKYLNKKMGLYVGWVCHSGSFADCMPIWNATRDVCLIFSGEDFTDLNAIKNFRCGGRTFASADARYLVRLYEALGIGFIERLNGWFSGILVDLRKQTVVVFNDRYGVGRIYYHESPDGFYFSSEAKALLKILPGLRQLDFQSLAETFSCGCVLQNRTLFQHMSLLPGGSRWEVTQNGYVRKDRYFSPETWEQQPTLSDTEFYGKLKETFIRILPRYFQGKNRLAMSLTGGLDGRMIMAWANRPPGELPCYTFGSAYRDGNDVTLARLVANLCQQPHTTIKVGPPFFSEFPALAEKAVYISDGTMDVTGAVELYVNQMARQIAPVRVTGNYGSEILRGNVAFRPGSLHADWLEPAFAQLVQTASTAYAAERAGHRLSFIGFKQVPWHHYARLSIEQSQLTPRSPYLDNELVSLLYQAPRNLLLSQEPAFRLIADGNPAMAEIRTDRGLVYHASPVVAHMQHFYQECTAKAEYLYDYGMPRWLASVDHLLAPLHLERLFLGRHKFYHFRVWYRDVLSQYVKDLLLDACTRRRPYLRGDFLEVMVNAHLKGNRNYALEIHRALTIELIQRQLIEQQ